MGVPRAEHVASHLITAGTYLVSAGGELVGDAGATVGGEVTRLVEEGAREVVLDLGDVTFVDSTAIAAIIDVGKRARRAGALVTVVCDDENVRRVLELVGLGRMVPLADTVTAAFAAVAARGSATAPAAA